MKAIMELLPNFPKGPLDRYRNVASFDWKKMKVFLDTKEIIQYKHDLLEELKAEKSLQPNNELKSLDKIRHDSVHQVKAIAKSQLTNYMSLFDNLLKPTALVEISQQITPGSYIKHGINRGMVVGVLSSLGTDKHQHFIQDIFDGRIMTCFCLTEIAHGTNTKAMRTTATFNTQRNGYILHTPDFEAAKCWAGSLGQVATHCVVYAQLYTPDGACHGLHQFFVQIRDLETHKPFPGVTVGDMGEKIGLNEVDNGFMLFDNFFVSKDALLNKNGDVTDDGRYVSPFKDPSQRFGASLASLSQGRVNITAGCTGYMIKGVTIALRYAAVRKQFGPDGEDEVPILEYQLHQHRLIPYLAGAYALKIFSQFIIKEQYQSNIDAFVGKKRKDAVEFGLEMHGISSASKPVSSWLSRDALQESREACAGHGYLKASGIGDARNNNDANCTYEGENHVLIQQTSNWLLKHWPSVMKGEQIISPLESINFLSNGLEILKDKFEAETVEHLYQPEFILRIYQWLVTYLLKQSYNKLEMNKDKGPFWAKNDNQVFYARNLAVAYIQHFILLRFLKTINEAECPKIRNVLVRLFGLYGLFSLEKHIGHLYQGGYFVGDKPATLLQDAILNLCKDLKDDSISLVDGIAPDDFVLNSILGNSDGNLYEHIKNYMYNHEGAFTRPEWYKEILTRDTKSKL